MNGEFLDLKLNGPIGFFRAIKKRGLLQAPKAANKPPTTLITLKPERRK
jgi:hypothetical protein